MAFRGTSRVGHFGTRGDVPRNVGWRVCAGVRSRCELSGGEAAGGGGLVAARTRGGVPRNVRGGSAGGGGLVAARARGGVPRNVRGGSGTFGVRGDVPRNTGWQVCAGVRSRCEISGEAAGVVELASLRVVRWRSAERRGRASATSGARWRSAERRVGDLGRCGGRLYGGAFRVGGGWVCDPAQAAVEPRPVDPGNGLSQTRPAAGARCDGVPRNVAAGAGRCGVRGSGQRRGCDRWAGGVGPVAARGLRRPPRNVGGRALSWRRPVSQTQAPAGGR